MDVSILVIAVVMLFAAVVAVGTRRYELRDEIYSGVTPGLEPEPGSAVERTKGAEYNGPIAVAFAPPKGVTPGMVGLIVDGVVDPHDLTATMIDLAIRGYLTIEPIRSSRKKDWILVRIERDLSDVLGLLDHERILLGLIPPGTAVKMSDLVRDRADGFATAARAMSRQAVEIGWYRAGSAPGNPRRRHRLRWAFASLLGAFIAIGLSPTGALGWVSAAVFLLAGVVRLFEPAFRAPRTAAGTAARIGALGFKQYLATAEADQIRFEEAADIFSRYLPYAIVFGVASHWAKIFKDISVMAEANGMQLDLDLGWFIAVDAADIALDLLVNSGGIELLAEGMGDFLGSLDGIGDVIGDVIGGIFDFFDF